MIAFTKSIACCLGLRLVIRARIYVAIETPAAAPGFIAVIIPPTVPIMPGTSSSG